MKKKTIIGLLIGAMLIIIAVWLNLRSQTAEKIAPTPTTELDSLLTYIDQSSNDVELAIKNFDDIDENLDNEKNLTQSIDIIALTDASPSDEKTTPPGNTAPIDEKTTPPGNTAPAPKTVNINTSDLDALLGEIDAAQNSANNSISDLDSINEDEDKVSI